MAKIIGVISARLSATARCPNKILLQLAGKTMLEHHIERMKAVKGLDGVFVATSRWPGNEKVTRLAEQCGVDWLAGSENDVIDRHIALCEREGADAAVRIPCDSPLFDIETTEQLVRTLRGAAFTPDYLYVCNVPYMCSTTTEMVSLAGLRKAHALYQGPAVTLPVWENWREFACVGLEAPAQMIRPEYKLMVDTPVDYVFMSHIYGALYDGKPIELRRVFEWLDNNPDIARLNAGTEYSAINKRFLEAQQRATANRKGLYEPATDYP